MIFKTSCSFKSKQMRMWLYNYFIIKKKFKKSTNGWLHSMWTVTSLLLPISLTFSPCCLVISRSVSQSNLFPTKRSSASSEAYCGILKEAAFQRWALSYPVRNVNHSAALRSSWGHPLPTSLRTGPVPGGLTQVGSETVLTGAQGFREWCGNRHYEPQHFESLTNNF